MILVPIDFKPDQNAEYVSWKSNKVKRIIMLLYYANAKVLIAIDRVQLKLKAGVLISSHHSPDSCTVSTQ